MILNHKGFKIMVISDTHGSHKILPLQIVDIAIHCGDACNDGNENELIDFLQWFSHYPATHKIFIAGNHELLFEFEPKVFKALLPTNIIFLNNEILHIDELTIVSIAARPWVHDLPVFDKLQKIDFLLTHAPPKNKLDKKTGCPKLMQFVHEHHPAYHIFGHIHEEGQKMITSNNTTFINCAIR